jgi:RNA polymerase sigma-70 factor, ECF subfamily
LDTRDGGRRDEELFGELYPSLRRFAAVVKPAEVDADDLVQEALARTLATGTLGQLPDPGAYLKRTIVNLASNARRGYGRARKAIRKLIEVDHIPTAFPSDLADLERLRPTERAAVYLAAVEAQPYAAIARTLGCSEGAARSRVSRGLRKLRAHLDEELRDV